MRITSKGQVTIPHRHPRSGSAPARHRGRVRGRRRRRADPEGRGASARARRAVGAAARPGHAQMTTDEIMALTRGEVSRVLVDSNVLLDVVTEDPRWFEWSSAALARAPTRAARDQPDRLRRGLGRLRPDRGTRAALAAPVVPAGALPWEAASWPGSASWPTAGGGAAALAAARLLHRRARGDRGPPPAHPGPARYRTYFPRLTLGSLPS